MSEIETDTPDTPDESDTPTIYGPDGDKLPEEVIEAAGDSDESEGDSDEAEADAEPEKPRKAKISFEASMQRSEAVAYFEAIVGGLKSGHLELRQAEEVLVLNPPDRIEVEVKARRKGDKGKVVFELEWSDENRPLEILN